MMLHNPMLREKLNKISNQPLPLKQNLKTVVLKTLMSAISRESEGNLHARETREAQISAKQRKAKNRKTGQNQPAHKQHKAGQHTQVIYTQAISQWESAGQQVGKRRRW
jgi:hypothetical protein